MQDQPPWLVALLFALGSAAIWWAGTRLEHYTDVIARRTGLGRAFAGLLLLAGATSLPELATTLTAVVLLDNPTLAVHNLIGGVALQTVVLVWADAVKGRRGALTWFSPAFVLLIEGVGLLMLLQLTILGMTARDAATVGGVSVWLILLALAYVGVLHLVYRYRGQPRWTPELSDDFPREEPAHAPEEAGVEDERPLGRVWWLFAFMSLVVLAGGWLSATTVEVLAAQTGLGDAFLGATLLALGTSLPEVSTTTAAVRQGRYTVAVSNIFGSNAFDVSLLLLADLLFRGGTVMAHGGETLVLVAALGSLLTAIYLWGLIERENRTVFGIGWDSAAALLAYLAGMVVLYRM